ncbi:MAG: hypothetical protein WCL02_07470 [bacterium]
MIENIVNFAKMNPWTMGITLLSLFLFIIRKKNIIEDAKLDTKMLNIFMFFIICIFVGSLLIMGISPDFATLINKEDFVLVYWFIVAGIWGMVKYITGVDPDDILEN